MRSETMKRLTAAITLLLLMLVSRAYAMNKVLTSVIRGTEGNEGIFGLAQITETPEGTVQVQVEVVGLSDGFHGIHFHTYGDEVGASDGAAAGGHYNPNQVPHAGPGDPGRHVADLGNIQSIDNKASYLRRFLTRDFSRPTVVSDFGNSVIGRSIVIHRDVDDLVSQPSGNAGPRLAIGVVGIANHELVPGNVEVTEHVMAQDFAPPQALVCRVRGEGISGTGLARFCNGVVEFSANVTGLTEGAHGMHVHWYGEEYEFKEIPNIQDRDLGRAGEHYNPTGVMHDLPGSSPRHYGDTGNIIADASGEGTLMTTVPHVPDLRWWVGRTCLIHADPDDGSQPAGNSGARIAAGQLGFANKDTFKQCQPISSEAALCKYIREVDNIKRVYDEKGLPRKGSNKLSRAVRIAKTGNVLSSMNNLRAATQVSESSKATLVARMAALDARNLVNTIISLIRGVIDNDTITRARSLVKKSNILVRRKNYSGAITSYRQALRIILFSDFFPSRMLSRPNCL